MMNAHKQERQSQSTGTAPNENNNKGNRNVKDILKPKGFKQSTPSLLLCTLAISVLSLALPVMTLQVYDRILPNPGTGTLPVLITGVCLAVLLEALLRLSRSYVIGRSGAKYEHLMACNAMDKVLGSDLSQVGSYGIGEHLHRMGSVGKLKDFYNGYALTVMAELAFVPLFLGLIVYIAHGLAFVPVTILVLFAATSLWKGRRLRQALKNREVADDTRFNFLIEALEGVHTVKSFALEEQFARRYEALEEDSTFENYHVTQETASTFNIGSIFSHLMVACVISAGAWCVLNGMLTTGGLIATLLLSGRMMQPIQRALGLWTRYQDYMLAREHLENLFTTPQKFKTVRQSNAPVLPNGRLVMERVGFKYNRSEAAILKDIHLDLSIGETVLVSGGHGCGKSTLLNVIAGIYPPTKGTISVDGEDINSYASEELVNHVGYIRTEPLIFRGTIRDNITCFGQTSEASAYEIASLLSVDRDVAKLSGGFDTFLNGNNTDSITPGLKQRITMVRVLATKPKIILFDNADRALDKEGYAMIYSLLARLRNKTSMVIISNDRNIRALANNHYILQNGQLITQNEHFSRGNVRPYKELRL